MARIIIRTHAECDMVTENILVSHHLRRLLDSNRGNPIWYEPPTEGEHRLIGEGCGKLPAQDVLDRATDALRGASKRHGRLPITVKCRRCGRTHVTGPCR